MRSALIAGAVLAAFAIVGITIVVSGTSPRQRRSFSVADIKGDSLGMSLEQYERKHPESHCGPQDTSCDLRPTSYAGVPFNKSASFTDAVLYDVTYFNNDSFSGDQVLSALKEKYGEPRCTTVNKIKGCDWWNGSATIRFMESQGGMSIRFTLDELASAASRKWEESRAQQSKTDQ
jgi:hypothetical protein